MKKLLPLLLVCCLMLTVAAAENIEVIYNNITVYINGVKTEFTDSMGNEVEPFIYNGNVYLPLPAVAEAMGVGYAWDGSTMSAHLGAAAGAKQYLLDVCMPYQHKYTAFYSTENGKSFSMAGNKYTQGMVIDTINGFALFNLNGKYSTLTCTVGHIDGESMYDVNVQFYLDGKLAKEVAVSAEGLPQTVTVNLNHALSMKVVVDCKYSGSDCCGIAEITVK